VSEHRCQEKVWPAGSMRSYPCGAKAKVERDGKHYCGRHDPVRVAEKKAARAAALKVEWEAVRVAAEARAEMQRRHNCHEALVSALKECAARLEIHMKHTEDLVAHMQATKALELAARKD
jgi:copper(I)-binding protein